MKSLGESLLEQKIITENQLEEAHARMRKEYMRLDEVLMDLRYISETDLCRARAAQLGVPFQDLSNFIFLEDVKQLIPTKICTKYEVVPLRLEGKKLMVAMNDVLNFRIIDDISFAAGKEIVPVLTSREGLKEVLDRNFGQLEVQPVEEDVELEILSVFSEDETVDTIDLAKRSQLKPIVRLVNSILQQAIEAGASDIHVEPQERALKIRHRIDGYMTDQTQIPKWTELQVISRFKIIASMDIARKNVPQDGKIIVRRQNEVIDIRVSSLPTQYGEKLVLRLLRRNKELPKTEQLGMSEENFHKMDSMLQNPHGLILVTGPTGSGKTTSLYSMLSVLNDRTKNIITIENPIEYHLEGASQVQTNEKLGQGFPQILRSILRQDPDIIMVGEIRDRETAEVAFHAAQTGHLVLSTLHTNNAASTVVRLLDMGVEPYVLASSLIGVVSQRLVRKICTTCQGSMLRLKCEECRQSGYHGRLGVFEVLKMDDVLRNLVFKKPSEREVSLIATQRGMQTLWEDCLDKIRSGITTIDECKRVAAGSFEEILPLSLRQEVAC